MHSTVTPLIISLPTSDRRRAYDFYRIAFDLEPVGQLADDGVPEPLVFELNATTRLMFVPTGGFGWVIGDNVVATPGTSECVLAFSAESEHAVNVIVERARATGATVAAEPAPQPWGYATTFGDPDGHLWMVTAAAIPD